MNPSLSTEIVQGYFWLQSTLFCDISGLFQTFAYKCNTSL